MSKKVSAFQVYSEDQTHQRHARSYRPAVARSQSQAMKYQSPPRSSRPSSMDWRDDVKVDSRGQTRHSSSPEVRRERSYNYDTYDSQRQDSAALRDTRYRDDVRQNGGRDHQSAQTRYRTDDQFDRRSWERDVRRDDYTTSGDRGNLHHKDDYLPSLDAKRQVPAKAAQSSAVYSDSDEECLHETLRRKKHQVDDFCVEKDDRRWSSDDDYNDYNQTRKRALTGDSYRSPSPEQVSDWRGRRQYSPQQTRQRTMSYSNSGEDSDNICPPPVKKKKLKATKKATKVKEKKHKTSVQTSTAVSSTKIQSLMDVKIPSSVKKQVEQNARSTTTLSTLGDNRTEFKFGRRNEETSRSLAQSQVDNRSRYDDANRNRSRYDSDYYQDHHREPAFGHRESESDRRGHHSHKDSYSSRHSPDYDRRQYQQTNDFDRGRDRQRRTSFSRDGRSNTEVVATKRKRQSSVERRDWSRNGGRTTQRDRSPEFRNYTDSDQDSDRGGRRSWRDERRDRQPKKKDEDRDKGQKGEKKTKSEKSKQDQATKSSQRTKKSSSAKKESRQEQKPAARMQVVPCKEGMAIFLTHPQEVCVRGRVRLQVMAGEVTVMGHTMEVKGSKTYDLFSPSTTSLITIATSCAEKEKKPLRKLIQALDVEEKGVKEFLTGAVVLRATRLDFAAGDYICTHPPFTQLFRYIFDRAPSAPPATPSAPDLGKVEATFQPIDQAAAMYLKLSDDFEEGLKKWTTAVKSTKTGPVGLLCGGVNSGKSTFSRYMINAALASVSKVCYLDCDVGQTEFSPPGSVALTVVDSPLFGPPFCHQKVAERMCFYGMVNPMEAPSHYVYCVEYVLKAYQEMENPPPLIVNTMGWNKDLGLQLFVDVLHLVSPDLVIQLNVATEVLNFPPITSQFVTQEPGWLYNTEPVEEEEESKEKEKKHEHVVIQSLVSSRTDPTRVKLTPKNLREISLLAHLMQGFPAGITLMSAKPYVIPWNCFAVHVCHSQLPEKLLIDSLHASVVALSKADLSGTYRDSEDLPLFFKDTPVCECLGYGVVRSIDHKTQTLKIVTPLSSDRLSQVNTLLKGSITIPDQLLLKQGHMDDVPFIDALEPAMALAPVRPRSRMPRRH